MNTHIYDYIYVIITLIISIIHIYTTIYTYIYELKDLKACLRPLRILISLVENQSEFLFSLMLMMLSYFHMLILQRSSSSML